MQNYIPCELVNSMRPMKKPKDKPMETEISNICLCECTQEELCNGNCKFFKERYHEILNKYGKSKRSSRRLV